MEMGQGRGRLVGAVVSELRWARAGKFRGMLALEKPSAPGCTPAGAGPSKWA
jgi:hypothetical protein